jgi:hypothetical protein
MMEEEESYRRLTSSMTAFAPNVTRPATSATLKPSLPASRADRWRFARENREETEPHFHFE